MLHALDLRRSLLLYPHNITSRSQVVIAWRWTAVTNGQVLREHRILLANDIRSLHVANDDSVYADCQVGSDFHPHQWLRIFLMNSVSGAESEIYSQPPELVRAELDTSVSAWDPIRKVFWVIAADQASLERAKVVATGQKVQ
jgi:hypothetical protein